VSEYLDCAAVVYLDGEDLDAVEFARQLDQGDPQQTLPLLYLGNFINGSATAPPPMVAQLIPPEATSGRRVAQLFWPDAFLSNMERVPTPLLPASATTSGWLNFDKLLSVQAPNSTSAHRLAQTTGVPAAKRQGLVAFMSQRCRTGRDAFFRGLCERLTSEGLGPCHALSDCPAGMPVSWYNLTSTESRSSTDYLGNCVERYADYKFVLAYESVGEDEVPRAGYITEKLMNPLLAGAVPIYHGDPWARFLFSDDAIVFVDPTDPAAAIERVVQLARDDAATSAMQAAVPLTQLGSRFLITPGFADASRIHDALTVLLHGH